MSDTVVRIKHEDIAPAETPKFTGQDIASDKKEVEESIEPPFTEYSTVNHRPYTADYFGVGEFWESKIGGFKPEMDEIEGFVADQVSQGKMDNSLAAVKEFYRKIEKMSGVDKTERTVIRIAKMAAYIKFMKETEHINFSNTKYG